MKPFKITLGIDASRNKSGGAVNYLQGIFNNIDPIKYDFESVHLWSYQSLLNKLPDYPWLHKHTNKFLQKNIFWQLYWQFFLFKKESKSLGCDIILNTDAGTISGASPSVTMSRDMLSYEKGEIERYGLSFQSIRLLLLRFIQNHSLRNSEGVIFLTKYASKVIQKSSGRIRNFTYIPHGIGKDFHKLKANEVWPIEKDKIKIVYVSNTDLYKHQWNVVKAVSDLRGTDDFNYELHLIGGGSGLAQRKLMKCIDKYDSERKFTFLHPFLTKNEIIYWLKNSDLFVFASSCENMPNTLLEGMSAGLPIACSYKGPMIEILKDGGIYFNPEEPYSIEFAISQLIKDEELRNRCKKRAKYISSYYSWDKCANNTLDFIKRTYLNLKTNES